MLKSARRHKQQTQFAAAEGVLAGLQDQLESAYNVFNNTADPDLLEASILEIRALQSRYGCTLRSLKRMSGEEP